jgi:hypothetical protein
MRKQHVGHPSHALAPPHSPAPIYARTGPPFTGQEVCSLLPLRARERSTRTGRARPFPPLSYPPVYALAEGAQGWAAAWETWREEPHLPRCRTAPSDDLCHGTTKFCVLSDGDELADPLLGECLLSLVLLYDYESRSYPSVID